ncbi:MAG: hypothetical protein ACI4QR_00120, partial [Eubacteriales bacterium]
WMIAVASAYITFLWLPISPEKIVTVAISLFLLRLLFPNDKKTLKKIYELKDSIKEKKKEHKEKKENAREKNSEEENKT